MRPAVDEVLVDLVGHHPQVVLHRPAPDGGDLGAGCRRRRSGCWATRRAGSWWRSCGPLSRASTVRWNPAVLGGGDVHRHPAGQGDGLGVGRPVRGGDEDLVAGVAQGGEGLVDGLLGPVGDEHLGGRDLVARVAPWSWPPPPPSARAGRRSACSGGWPGSPAGLDGRLHDVGGRREVGLAGTEADDVLAGRPQRLGLGVDGQRGRRGDGGDPGRDPPGRRRPDRRRGWCSWMRRMAAMLTHVPTASDTTDHRPISASPTGSSRPTGASAVGPSKVRPAAGGGPGPGGAHLPRHEPPAEDGQVRRGPAAQRPERAFRPSRRLRGGARQRRHHVLLGHRHLLPHRASQPAPVVRRVLLQVRRRGHRPHPTSTSPGSSSRRPGPIPRPWPTPTSTSTP